MVDLAFLMEVANIVSLPVKYVCFLMFILNELMIMQS